MSSDLLTLRRTLSNLQSEYRKMRKRERSEDTRHKIELGGLVIDGVGFTMGRRPSKPATLTTALRLLGCLTG